ncbi:hypothetical protein JRQ81_017017 [Phrynocephalus forsythii]|uniref:RAP domain-containing protein n=1 Tax=Phrynocephalus forsythii TaxID=171643 RepID=A0A9Q0XU78_9SAUR|nr:hypothetical protein JRQ81_017017 [Phrynocephalus forsythii]
MRFVQEGNMNGRYRLERRMVQRRGSLFPCSLGSDSDNLSSIHVPGTSTRLIIVAMATRIMYGRFAGRSCRAAAFSTTTKVHGQKMLFGKAEESQSTIKAGKEPSAAISIRLWAPLEYRMPFNPSAYPVARHLHHEDASRSLRNRSPEGDSAAVSPKQIRNTHSASPAKRLSKRGGTLLEDDEVLLKQAHMKDGGHDDDDDTDTCSNKGHARIFLKQRLEYRSLCYNREEFSHSLSTEEAEEVLKRVSVLKSSLQPETIAEYFFKLSCLPAEQHRLLLSNVRFDMLCQYSVKKIKMFDAADLITILKAFVTLGIPPSHLMLKNYEREFCRRAWDLSLDQLLLVADLWYCMGCKVPWYWEIMLSCANQRWKKLTLPHLVQLIYIIGEGRRAPEELMQKLDLLVSTHMESLSVEELGVICLGFFKSKHELSEPTVKKIGLKVCAHFPDISDLALVNILKMYRFTYSGHMDFMKQLGQVVPPRIQTITVQSLMHITLACSSLHYLDESLMKSVGLSVPSKVASCRCKDVAKLLWSFGNLNYKPPNEEEFYASLEEQLRVTFHEFQKFPEHLITALIALAFANRFHYDLIDYALSPDFIALSRSRAYCPERDLLTLDGTLEIECPDYTGNRLTSQFREEAMHKVYSSARQTFYEKPEIKTAVSTLEDMLGGPQYIKKHLILPHNRTVDLEIHLDSNQNPLPFNSEPVAAVPLPLRGNSVALTDDLINQLLMRTASSQTLLADVRNEDEKCVQKREVPQNSSLSTGRHSSFSDGVPLTGPLLNALIKPTTSSADPCPRMTQQSPVAMKLAIQVSSRNHYCFGSKHLLGFHSMKMRQLRKIGYVVIEVPPWEWSPLLNQSSFYKQDYLYRKVFGSLDEMKAKCPEESEF